MNEHMYAKGAKGSYMS